MDVGRQLSESLRVCLVTFASTQLDFPMGAKRSNTARARLHSGGMVGDTDTGRDQETVGLLTSGSTVIRAKVGTATGARSAATLRILRTILESFFLAS